jgi:hypothetical protein
MLVRFQEPFIVNIYLSASGPTSCLSETIARRERNEYFFLKSVYCLSGLRTVRKNRRIPKHFKDKKVFVLRRTHCFNIEICSFFTIL